MNFAVLKMYAEDNRDSRGWGRYQKFLQAIISSIENLVRKSLMKYLISQRCDIPHG